MDAVSLPDNLEALKAIIADKDSYISQLEEQVRLLKSLHYQFKSEKAKLRNRQGQLSLFNEVELAVIELEKQAEESSAAEELERVDAHVRRKKGRRPLSPDLPRVDRIHDIADDAKICPCGCALKKIGEEVSEKLDVTPRKSRSSVIFDPNTPAQPVKESKTTALPSKSLPCPRRSSPRASSPQASGLHLREQIRGRPASVSPGANIRPDRRGDFQSHHVRMDAPCRSCLQDTYGHDDRRTPIRRHSQYGRNHRAGVART
jgi:hypothetical protein